MTGKIFSIEEFSTFDGPGVRTTVFFKGCPLQCAWCHNPEGQRFADEILRSPNGCLGCNACLEEGRKQTGIPSLVEESIAVCPRNLIRHCGETLTPEALVARLEPKLEMLNLTGGGVTFSGGEPLAQAPFVLECLRLLRQKTNRALQTSGFCDRHTFEAVLRECDYVLFDLKHMDDQTHRRYTGQSNELILENYACLAKSGVPFITRIPLIPSVNDTAENLDATARFMKTYGVRKIELLPYNRSAGAKYQLLNRTYEVDFDGMQTPQPHKEIFESYGIEVSVL